MTNPNELVTYAFRPDARCPECGGSAVEASTLTFSRAPVVDDWIVCFYCSSILRVTPTGLRLTTLEERSGPDAPPELLQFVQAVLRAQKA